MSDKRTTLEEAVAGVASGMTIGIGAGVTPQADGVRPRIVTHRRHGPDGRDLRRPRLWAALRGRQGEHGVLRLRVAGFAPVLRSLVRQPDDGAIVAREMDEGMPDAGFKPQRNGCRSYRSGPASGARCRTSGTANCEP